MATCNHRWQGTSEGVQCLTCGLRLSHKDYIKLIAPKAPEKTEGAQKSAQKKGTAKK